jgi:hypothetical protein
MRVSVPATVAQYIAERIARFPIERHPDLAYQEQYVAGYGALPLLIDWTCTIGITPDGALLEWSTDNDNPWLKEVSDQRGARLALARGPRLFPGVAPLMPVRDPSAVDCPHCAGAGVTPLASKMPNLVCFCGGLGWVDPSEL